MNEPAQDGIAIVGMAGRFPGAASVDELWANLLAGREAITRFAADELSPRVPRELREHPRYVAARGIIADAARFDAALFGIPAREAQLIDPQQRIFLELCWSALEHAGIDPARSEGSIGVWAGTSNNGYRKLIDEHPEVIAASGEFAAMLANEKDYVATRVAHRLGLTGPAISLYTACSTSLVAVAQAWYGLMSWQCDVALAGGVNLVVPQESGYLPAEGAIESADGHCRPFAADASGTVFSSGAGVVVLKRLADALAQGDTIYAVIRGVGVNNDGADKASFSAPSVRGQSAAIRLALDCAGLDAGAIGYVEAHGTGTLLGDPIEVEALTRAFRGDGAAAATCWLGSLKGNLGHLVAASGVAGLIKATLALYHERIPPSINLEQPNPQIDFAHSPFRLAREAVAWPRGATPRRAGVSSFGIGGTNAHVVLEEAPPAPPAAAGRGVELLLLSAHDEAALQRRAQQLAQHLEHASEAQLPDIAATLALGRRELAVRGAVVARDAAQAASALAQLAPQTARHRKIALLFPGQGSQHVDMARELVATEPVFAAEFERCCALAGPHLGCDLRALILPPPAQATAAAERLAQTRYTQPALFAVEYALARLWESCGIVADVLIGHSSGEYVAATLAGVFTLEQAVMLVCARGAAMQAQPTGAMLAVRAAPAAIAAQLGAGLDLAAHNAPELCVVAGTGAAIDDLAQRLTAQHVASTRLKVSHAFHSALMAGALEPFERAFAGLSLAAPTRPFHSCVSGAPITAQEATSVAYWCRQLRQPVQFASAIAAATADGVSLFIEAGPSHALTSFVRSQLGGDAQAVATLGPAAKPGSDAEHFAAALGACWVAGATPDWSLRYAGQGRRRIGLPTYPFGGQRHWIDPPLPVRGATEEVSMNEVQPTPAAPVTTTATADTTADTVAPAAADAALRVQLRALVESLTGERIDASHDTNSFLELGLDSLSLTQAALELERQHGVKLKFRRLLEDLDSIASLAGFIASTRPQPVVAALAPAAMPTPTPTPIAAPSATTATATAPADLLDLLRSQQALMQQQMQLLARLAGAAAPAVAAPSPSVATPAVATAPPPAAGADALPADLGARPFGASARITRQRELALTPAQHAWIDDFTQRYNARTARSKAFAEHNRACMADPRVVTGFNPLWKELVYPIVVERSQGAYLYDLDGNQYVDCLNAFGANFLGYQPSAVAAALHQQIDAGYEIGPQHPLTAEVAALIAEMTGMARVAFCNTGSEAVMGAMRIARTVTGRRTIAIFTNSYHGIFDEVIVRGTRSLRSIAAAPGILASAVENVLVLDYGSDAALQVLRERGHELAAIMIEPVQGRNPTLQPRAFVQALRAICDEAGCALIFDEVITGFRLAQGGAQAFYGVRADIATYGKIIGGGLPLAAIAGSAHWLDALDGGDWHFGDDSVPEAGVTYFAGTFVRHPLALAAARAALLHLKRSGPALQETLNARSGELVARLNALFEQRAAPLTAVGCSSLWRIVADEDQPCASLFWYALRGHGLHLYEQFNCFLTEAHGAVEVERIHEAVRAALDELLAAGLLRPRAAPPALPAAASAPAAAATTLPETVALTDGQLEKWLGCQYGPSAALACNEAVLLEFDGTLDRSALEDALHNLWQRHEAFRCAISANGRSLVLQALPPLPLREVDLAGADAQSALADWCEREMRTPFDLTQAPLLRFALLRLGAQRHALHVIGHHLILDGWSLAVLCEELQVGYNAAHAGHAAQLPAAQSLRAYALAEHARRAGNGAAQLAWWNALYAELPAPLDLPADPTLTAGADSDFDAATERHEFGVELSTALRAQARRRGVTLYGLLLGAFGLFLARLSGQRDFAVAVPFAGQALAGSGALIGDGVNTLPLRLRIAAHDGIDAAVAGAQAALLDAAEHQDLSLLTIVRARALRRRGARGALADVIFNLNPRVRAPQFSGLVTRWRDCPHVALLWNLFFNLNDDGRQLTLDLHYRTALYQTATIQRWIAQYERLLEEVAMQTPTHVLPAAAVATATPAAPAPRPDTGSLLDLIAAQVQATPDRIAVSDAGASYSYAQLWHASAQVAARLLASGVGRGELVGICMPRRCAMLAAALGILRAGAAYVPLDAAFPAKRLQLMAERAALRHVVVLDGEAVPDAVNGPGIALVAFGDGELRRAAAVTPLPAVSGADLAYVLFTSGSTGEPKGVRILHRNLVNFLCSMREQPGFDADDVICAVTTLSFDIAGLELYLPLICGARVHIASEAQVRDPQQARALFKDCGASVLQTTPTLLRLLCEGDAGEAVAGLRLLVGGEAMPRDLASLVLPHCRQLWNMYGPTETTIWSTLHRVVADEDPVPLGRPIANTRIHVLDAAGQAVAPGERGEIWIGGDGVADGYLNRPDLTAERFRADPFAADGSRMYRTGDAGSLRDGVLQFHGRIDDQVKVRGFRVELGDIEAAAHEDPLVREAAAAVREFGPHDQRLVLYVTARDRFGDLATRLRERLRDTLPAYMRPSHIVVVESMPTTPNGKIDRKALPPPAEQAAPAAAPAAAVVDARETYLAALWCELIGVAAVQADDNFFDLGGDSLLAVDMLARVERETGTRLNVLAIATGTLASIATALPQESATLRGGWLSRLRGWIGARRTG